MIRAASVSPKTWTAINEAGRPEGEDYLQHEGRGFNDINGARWYYVEFEPDWE